MQMECKCIAIAFAVLTKMLIYNYLQRYICITFVLQVYKSIH